MAFVFLAMALVPFSLAHFSRSQWPLCPSSWNNLLCPNPSQIKLLQCSSHMPIEFGLGALQEAYLCPLNLNKNGLALPLHYFQVCDMCCCMLVPSLYFNPAVHIHSCNISLARWSTVLINDSAIIRWLIKSFLYVANSNYVGMLGMSSKISKQCYCLVGLPLSSGFGTYFITTI